VPVSYRVFDSCVSFYTGSPDGMFTAGTQTYRQLNDHPSFTRFEKGPISESDFFSWEALICGPKDTPFVSCPFCDKPSIQDSDALRKAAFLRPN
jgi:hypothetical protein